MRSRSLLTVSLLLLTLGACRDPNAPRPVSELPPPPPGSGPLKPLSTRDAPGTNTPTADAPATDVRPVAPTPRAVALPPGVPDPAEAGISDLARLARYVFREMRANEAVCSFSNPLHDPISFVFHIEVEAGRMTQVHLAGAGVRAGDELRRLESVPPELTAYAECLGSLLRAVQMDPPPADGVYQPEYSYPGHRDPL